MGESYTERTDRGASKATDGIDEWVAVGAHELCRLRELAALGEQLARFRHDVNNPLTALLAEAQLLEMEPLDASAREATRRIVTICRRVIGEVRELGTKSGEA